MTPAIGLILRSPPGWVSAPGGILPTFDNDFAGARYFPGGGTAAALTETRSSTTDAYVDDLAGTWYPVGANLPRITNKGLRVEESHTNVALWCRDLTNAAWTKSNVTAAKDQTGIDGIANSASSITATSGNGTVLQAITLASSARWQSAFVKRITGSGTINMTMDNGSTWTAVTATSAWTRVEIPTQTLANPTVGFRIVTNGDAVAVDFVQNEDNGVFASSPILTTTVAVTRSSDKVQLGGSRLIPSVGSVFLQTNRLLKSGNLFLLELNNGAGTNVLVANATSATIRAAGVSSTATIGGSGNFSTGRVKVAASWDGSGTSIVANNGTLVTSANVMAAALPQYIGSNGGGGNAISGDVERLVIWPTRVPDAYLSALTA